MKNLTEYFILDWKYLPGDPKETFQEYNLPDFARAASVQLPHRILLPNRTLWYSALVNVKSESHLFVKADDGFQVFLNGNRVVQSEDEPIRLSGNIVHQITIRVINNAMEGGLAEVQIKEKVKPIIMEIGLKTPELQHQSYNRADAKKVGKGSQTSTLSKKSIDHNVAGFVTGPYLQFAKGQRIVCWESKAPTDSQLLWRSIIDTRWQTVKIHSNKSVNKVSIPAQNPGSYEYKILSNNTESEVFTFTVLPSTDTSHFAVWGDSQGGWNTFTKIALQMQSRKVEFAAGVGDLVNHGADSLQWISFFNALKPLASSTPLMLIAGNHDYDGYYHTLQPEQLLKYLSSSTDKTYFSWAYKNAYFIAMDPNENFPVGIFPNSSQAQWLKKELASEAFQSAQWRFLLFHQPPYSQGWKGYEGEESMRLLCDTVVPDHKIDFVLSGHTHHYERLQKHYSSHKANYIITGGGGGSLEDGQLSTQPVMDKIINQFHFTDFTIQGAKVIINIISDDGKILDSFVVNK